MQILINDCVIYRYLIPRGNRPKYEKVTKSADSRFKITPKIIQLSKYKNCNTSNKGPKSVSERMIKVYRPRNHMRDGMFLKSQ